MKRNSKHSLRTQKKNGGRRALQLVSLPIVFLGMLLVPGSLSADVSLANEEAELHTRKVDFERRLQMRSSAEIREAHELDALKANRQKEHQLHERERSEFVEQRNRRKPVDSEALEISWQEEQDRQASKQDLVRKKFVQQREVLEALKLKPAYWVDPAREYDLHNPALNDDDDEDTNP